VRNEDLGSEPDKNPPREARKVRPREHSAVGRRDARETGAAGALVRAACLSTAGPRGLPGGVGVFPELSALCK